MSRIRLYFDEDAMQNALVVALRARRIDVLTGLDCRLIGRGDEDQLLQAAGHDWIAAGRQHAGIILAFQQRYSIGEQLRRLLHLINLR